MPRQVYYVVIQWLLGIYLDVNYNTSHCTPLHRSCPIQPTEESSYSLPSHPQNTIATTLLLISPRHRQLRLPLPDQTKSTNIMSKSSSAQLTPSHHLTQIPFYHTSNRITRRLSPSLPRHPHRTNVSYPTRYDAARRGEDLRNHRNAEM